MDVPLHKYWGHPIAIDAPAPNLKTPTITFVNERTTSLSNRTLFTACYFVTFANLVNCVILYIGPVSYTHLTLPTIYSV